MNKCDGNCTPNQIVDARTLAYAPGYVCGACGRLLKTSASGVKTFQTCPRRWAFEYILGHKSPSTAVLEFGTAVHDYLERALKGETQPTNTPPNVRDIAELGLERFRGLGLEPVLVESAVSLPFDVGGGPIDFRGRIDVYARGADGACYVVDWKTVGSPKWAQTAETLRTDYQLAVYARWLQSQGHAVDYTGHIQLFKNGAEYNKGTPTVGSVFVPAPDFDQTTAQIMPALHAMDAAGRAVYAARDLKAAEADESACWTYRVLCHHNGPCKGPNAIVVGGPKMSIMDRLRAIKSAQAPPAPAPEPAPEAPPADDNPTLRFNPPDAEPPPAPEPWTLRDIEAFTEIDGIGPGVIEALRGAGFVSVGDVFQRRGQLPHVKGLGPKKAQAILDWIRAVPQNHPNPALRLAPAPEGPPAPCAAAAALKAALRAVMELDPEARRAAVRAALEVLGEA